MLLDRLTSTTSALRESLADLDPERLSGADAERLLAAFVEIERLAGTGRLLAARRVESSNIWRRTGHRSAAAHLAEATGTGIGPALATLETARQLHALPTTEEAARQGRLSEPQLKEIAGAATLKPEAEQSLVDAATQQPLSVLKLRCRRVRAEHADSTATYEAIRKSRYLRNWTESDGAVRLDARLTPDEGARLLAAVHEESARLGRRARRSGVTEPGRALAADALVFLATRSGSSDDSGPRAVLHVRVDHAALLRGQVEGDELCELPGVGPIPVEVARRLAGDAILNVLVTKAEDVTAVAHSGRTIPTALRRALIERDPMCVVPSCTTRDHLEIDHVIPFATGGRASLDNLVRLCHWHHYLKTHHQHRIEPDPEGGWRWLVPAEPATVPKAVRLRSGPDR